MYKWLNTFIHKNTTSALNLGLGLILLSLAGCGWQLRDYEPSASYSESKIAELRISSSSRDNAFFRRFYAALKRNNILEENNSDYVLEIFREDIDRKPLAYNRIGTPSQYKLTLSIEYRFSYQSKVLQETTKIVSRRNYDFDPNLIIAKDKEQEALITEMRDEISQRIINSINSKL